MKTNKEIVEECIGVMGNKAYQGSYAAPREAFRNILTTCDTELQEAIEGVEIERAHTYASENADVYRAHDAGQEQMKNRILTLLKERDNTTREI